MKKRAKTIDEVCGKPEGTFLKFLEGAAKYERQQLAKANRRLKKYKKHENS